MERAALQELWAHATQQGGHRGVSTLAAPSSCPGALSDVAHWLSPTWRPKARLRVDAAPAHQPPRTPRRPGGGRG